MDLDGLGRIFNDKYHKDFTPVTFNQGGLFTTSKAWFEVIFVLGKVKKKNQRDPKCKNEFVWFQQTVQM